MKTERMPRAMAVALLIVAAACGWPTAAAAQTPAPAAAATAAPACPDVDFIGARGSGEDNEVSASTRYTSDSAHLGLGAELYDVYTRLAATATRTDRTIGAFGVPYPAVGIDVLSADALLADSTGTYLKSVELGAHAATAELERVHRDCPDTAVVVGGYSQGAQVMVDAVLAATPGARASIRAAVFFGNTYFNSAEAGNDFGGYQPGLDGYLVHAGELPEAASLLGLDGTTWADAFDSAVVLDYCHDGDPICGLVRQREVDGVSYSVRDFAHIVSASSNAAGQPSIFAKHTDYKSADTRNAAQRIRLALGWPVTTPKKLTPTAVTGPATAVAGQTVEFNAGGTLSDPGDPVVSYTWAIDAGQADARTRVTETPLLQTEFLTKGDHTVTVKTTTSSGATGSASAAVSVTAAPSSPPPAPDTPTGTGGDHTVTLEWPAVTGAEFYAIDNAANGKQLAAFTPLDQDQSDVSWTDTGLHNGSERLYVVTAVNSAGASTASHEVDATPRASQQTATPQPTATTGSAPAPVEGELAWAVGLGLIALVLATSLTASGRRGRGSTRESGSGDIP